MGKVIWHVIVSLDGFITGSGHTTNWVTRYASVNPPEADELIGSTGAVLGGRRGYDLGRRSRHLARASDKASNSWRGPVFVLTHHPPSDESDPAITFLSTSIGEAVATALDAASGKNLLILGADVARQCIDEKLLNEILAHVAPVLLGDGIRLFGRPGAPVGLETISVSHSGPLVTIRYQVPKAISPIGGPSRR